MDKSDLNFVPGQEKLNKVLEIHKNYILENINLHKLKEKNTALILFKIIDIINLGDIEAAKTELIKLKQSLERE